MTVDDFDPVIERHDSLENQIKIDICAESSAIDNHNKGRKKSKRRTKAKKANIDNSTQNIEHQFIEVTPEEILSQDVVPNVTTRSQSKSKRNSGSGSRRGSKRGSKRKNN